MAAEKQSLRPNHRKALVGRVVSTKNAKTIIVAVDTYTKHPLYGKRFRKTKKFAAHDEQEQAQVGDLVKIVSTRPYSKTKTFRLDKIRQTLREGQ